MQKSVLTDPYLSGELRREQSSQPFYQKIISYKNLKILEKWASYPNSS